MRTGISKKIISIILSIVIVCSSSAVALAIGETKFFNPEVGEQGAVDMKTKRGSTDFYMFPYEGLLITDRTPDHVKKVGSTASIGVNVAGVSPVRFEWFMSADGGKTWNPVAGATNSGVCSLYNLQANTPPEQPYIYQVRVTDADTSTPVCADIKILVSDEYEYRTIETKDGDVAVSAYMTDDAKLRVLQIDKNSPAHSELSDGLSLGTIPFWTGQVELYNSKKGKLVPYFGELQLDLALGDDYNGMEFCVMGLINGEIMKYIGTVVDGMLEVFIGQLGTFMFEVLPVSGIDIHEIIASAGHGGTISFSGTVYVSNGENKRFTFLPNAGYVTRAVYVDDVLVECLGNYYDFDDVVGNHKISVLFEKIKATEETHVLKVVCGENGSATPTGSLDVPHGQEQTVYFTPNSGYVVDKVTINGVEESVIGNSFTITAMTQDVVMEVTFKKGSEQPVVFREVNASAGKGGSISPSGTTKVEYGGDMWFYFIPDEGYRLASVFVDGVELEDVTGNSYHLVNVTENRTIRAAFVRTNKKVATKFYNIFVNDPENGRVYPSGKLKVEEGSSVAFKFYPDDGYSVEEVFVDGKSIGARSSFTMTDIQKSHRLRVRFGVSESGPKTSDEGEATYWIIIVVSLAALFTLLIALIMIAYRRKHHVVM